MVDMFELENDEKDDASMMTRVSRVSSLENGRIREVIAVKDSAKGVY